VHRDRRQTQRRSEIDGSPTTGDLEESSEDRRGFSLRRRLRMPLKVRLHRWRRRGCAQEFTFLSLSSLLLFFSLGFSHLIRSCFSLSLSSLSIPFSPSLCFFVPSHIPRTPARRDVTAITDFLSLLLSLSHTRLLRSTVLSLTRSHKRGCEKSSMGPTDRLSLSLSIQDNDDDRWGRPTSASILTACVYRVLLLLYTHPSRRPPRLLVIRDNVEILSEKPLSTVSRDFFFFF